MGKIKNLNLKATIIITFTFVVLLTSIIVGLFYRFLAYNSTALNNIYKEYGVSTGDAGLSYAKYNEVKVALRNALYIYEPGSAQANSYIDKAKTAMDAFDENFSLFKEEANADDATLQSEADKAEDAVNKYFDGADSLISLYKSGNYDGARALLLNELVDIALAADDEMEELINVTMPEAADTQLKALAKEQTNLFIALCVLFVVYIVLIIFGAFIIIKKIRSPLNNLLEASAKISMGDVEFDIEKRSDDELGQLTDSFKKMKATIAEQAEIAYSIANGDLSCDVSVHSDKDVLGNALRILVQDNNKILSNIKESSLQLTTGAEQVAIASQSLAQGSTEQASAIEEITASMQDIEEKTRDNAAKAEEAGELVHKAKESATAGNEQMHSMVGAMKEINESSENISKIIKVIDDIAFQTNILALNAAVEAARAGVHGKGFAVVAEEVRNLAGKSASAASETAEMIEDSIHKVNVGSRMAEETSEALDGIMSAVDAMVDLIGQITVASNDQATAISQIDQAISQVSQVVQTNSATSEECAAASEELSNQAAALRTAISKFKLKETSYRSNISYTQDSFGGSDSSEDNESIISLGGGFGKY